MYTLISLMEPQLGGYIFWAQKRSAKSPQRQNFAMSADLAARIRAARALRAAREEQLKVFDTDMYEWMVSGWRAALRLRALFEPFGRFGVSRPAGGVRLCAL